MKLRRSFAAALPLALAAAFAASPASAHCDAMDGPVVTLAQTALAKGNVNLVLPWVPARSEAEIRSAFDHTLAVRKLSPEARQLADTYFFETLVRVHRASEGAVLGEIDANPTFARRVIAGLASRIEALVHELGAQAGGSARQRVAAYLLRRSGGTEGEMAVALPATKAAVASQLGLTPEHFSRTLGDLAARGVLRVEGRRIVIGDAAALAQHAATSRRKRVSA